jgi:tripeptide aminopeptidase
VERPGETARPGASGRRAGDVERARLSATFARLCEVESPSGQELAIARAVRADLEALGLEVVEDDTAAQTGAECGNLLVRLPGPREGPAIMLGAHLDTVPLTDRVEVECVDGVFTNRRQAILGADDKAAVAVLMELAHAYAGGGAPVTCELLFTMSEENGLRGAKAFDVSRLESGFGYVLDHASPIGELILAAPSYYHVTADFRGRSAHSGLRPEDGRSAIVAAAKAIESVSLGRIDEGTTANVGRIEGGTATNVVPAHCRVEAEVRSLDDANARRLVAEMVDSFSWAASSTETDVDAVIEQQFHAYRIPESDPSVAVAAAALRDCGIEPVYTATGGGSDANAFQSKGFRCLNIANGTEANHTPDERVSVAALELMLDVMLNLVERAAAPC